MPTVFANQMASSGTPHGTEKRVDDHIFTIDPRSFRFGDVEIVGESKKLRSVIEQAELVAPTNCTALIEGETGTGKELVAALIHHFSARRDQPFVKVNCAAIPLGLLESELFGHERGAFTGAVAQRVGRFERANRGSIFLDEVGDIPLELQPKLLRVLQEQEFERLGSTHTVHTDVRVIAATHRHLGQMVEGGHFRADLFYRLRVFPISIPPLREHAEDIPDLVDHFTQKFAMEMTRRIESIPLTAMRSMEDWAWPGNIRELQNFIERAVILSRGPRLEPPVQELCAQLDQALEPVTLRDAERAHIRQTLQKTHGQLARAATLLDIPRSTLFYKIRRLGIPRASAPKNAPQPADDLNTAEDYVSPLKCSTPPKE